MTSTNVVTNLEFPYARFVPPREGHYDTYNVNYLVTEIRPPTVTREDYNPLSIQEGMSPWTWPNDLHILFGREHVASMQTTLEPPPAGWLHHWGPAPDNLYSLVPVDYDFYQQSQSGFLHRLEFMRYELPDGWHWHNAPRPFAS